MKLTYQVEDKVKFGPLVVFAFQQLLAILAATIAVPAIINSSCGLTTPMSTSAALFGAGVGTLIYLVLTKFKSPVFLGSSFAFIGSMCAAFAGGVSMALGYLGIIMGAVFAGLVYVVIAILVKAFGVGWINKLMPAVVIGPTVAIIGLSLAGNAIGDMFIKDAESNNVYPISYITFACGLITLFVTILCSTYGKKFLKMIPFIVGIASGYIVATIITLASGGKFMLVDFSAFSSMKWYPDFTFITAAGGFKEITGTYVATIAVAYIPVAFVVFAEHIADHKNLSSIIERDLLEKPGLHRTLLGDGIGSMCGAFFGGCPNTTYGESVGCVAISGNASVMTILATAVLAIVASFFAPFVTLLSTIPSCVMGGVCVALYGFIAVSGLKMVQGVDLNKNKNLFVVSVILIAGIGGLTLHFGKVTVTEVACALILGIITNLMLKNSSEE